MGMIAVVPLAIYGHIEVARLVLAAKFDPLEK